MIPINSWQVMVSCYHLILKREAVRLREVMYEWEINCCKLVNGVFLADIYLKISKTLEIGGFMFDFKTVDWIVMSYGFDTSIQYAADTGKV